MFIYFIGNRGAVKKNEEQSEEEEQGVFRPARSRVTPRRFLLELPHARRLGIRNKIALGHNPLRPTLSDFSVTESVSEVEDCATESHAFSYVIEALRVGDRQIDALADDNLSEFAVAQTWEEFAGNEWTRRIRAVCRK
jgi:hypothetical protein